MQSSGKTSQLRNTGQSQRYQEWGRKARKNEAKLFRGATKRAALRDQENS